MALHPGKSCPAPGAPYADVWVVPAHPQAKHRLGQSRTATRGQELSKGTLYPAA